MECRPDVAHRPVEGAAPFAIREAAVDVVGDGLRRRRASFDEAEVVREVPAEPRVQKIARLFRRKFKGVTQHAAGGIPCHRGVEAVVKARSPETPSLVGGGQDRCVFHGILLFVYDTMNALSAFIINNISEHSFAKNAP